MAIEEICIYAVWPNSELHNLIKVLNYSTFNTKLFIELHLETTIEL